MLVMGTSATVEPAAYLPMIAKERRLHHRNQPRTHAPDAPHQRHDPAGTGRRDDGPHRGDGGRDARGRLTQLPIVQMMVLPLLRIIS
jgi:hypothetical protein